MRELLDHRWVRRKGPAGYGWRGAFVFTSVGDVRYRLKGLLWRLRVPTKQRAIVRWLARLDRLRLRVVLDDADELRAGNLTTRKLAAAARTLERDALRGGRLRRLYWARADRKRIADLESHGWAIVPADFHYYSRDLCWALVRNVAPPPGGPTADMGAVALWNATFDTDAGEDSD